MTRPSSVSAVTLSVVRHGVALDHQRMVARRLERAVDAAKHARALMPHLGKLAMHRLRRAHDVAAERLADRLMAEADAEDRNGSARPCSIRSRQMPASFGVQGPGDSTIASGFAAEHVLDRDLVVAMHGHVRPEPAQIMDEVEGEAVVIVDQHDHGRLLGHFEVLVALRRVKPPDRALLPASGGAREAPRLFGGAKQRLRLVDAFGLFASDRCRRRCRRRPAHTSCRP